MKKAILSIFCLAATLVSQAQTFDTTGISNNWESLINSYDTWSVGAFNANKDLNDAADFGWGSYNVTTHIIGGDSIYILKTVNGNYKAISIDQLASGIFSVTYSNLDGTGRATKTFDRTSYPDRNFMYFAMDTEVTKDLEPSNNDWDVLFSKYLTVFPGFGGYPVSGALTNIGTKTSQVEFASGGTYSVNDTLNFPMSDNISTIGYDWKDAFAGIIHDTVVYYVKDRTGNVNELKFEGYSGSATGIFKFTVNGQLDSIVLGTGNVDQVYYSLENKASLSTNQDTEWDIALYAQSSFSAIPIRINDVNGTELYVYPKKDIAHWNSIGINETASINLVSVYPNPSKGQVNLVINSINTSNLTYSIIDQSGRVIESKSLDTVSGLAEYSIDLQNVSTGMYFLKVVGDGYLATTNLMVQP